MVSRSAVTALSAVCFGVLNIPSAAQAQRLPSINSLSSLFHAAWDKQPEALLAQSRRDAALAQERLANEWTPEPPAIEAAVTSDRVVGNNGGREIEVGVSFPLWLPGEKQQQRTWAQAQTQALESRRSAAQLRVAASVREAWWNWQRALSDVEAAQAQLTSAQMLSEDVAKRVKAGDLARADQHQALGAVAASQALIAQALANKISSEAVITSLAGPANLSGASAASEVIVFSEKDNLDRHADLLSFRDRATAAEAQVALLATQTRANPELKIATTRSRGAYGEAYNQSLVVGVRFPLGSANRQTFRVASARLDLEEINAQLAFDKNRLTSEFSAARARVSAAQALVKAIDERARLAVEAKDFFSKSFRLGETDLPTRLRIDAEAAESLRAASRSRIDLAAAISAARQALGQLPQ